MNIISQKPDKILRPIFSFFSIYLLLLGSAFLQKTLAQVPDDNLKKIAFSKYWLRLLHYEEIRPGHYLGRADGDDFYFSHMGKTDPYQELMATILAFSSQKKIGIFKLHAQCAFPERFRFLSQELSLNIKKEKCPNLTKWKKDLQPESLTLIFAASYPDNPPSLFGHTFLRINSKLSPRVAHNINHLLDYGVNFAAATVETNGILFSLKGLLGFYEGRFSITPYVQKVNEYAFLEGRDLWEYDLDLTSHELEKVLNHLWELGTTTYFDYYFFTENCSALLLQALEVADINLELIHHLRFMYVLPTDTLKAAMKSPGLIKKVNYYPSLWTILKNQYDSLSPSQQEHFLKLTHKDISPTSKTPVHIIDTYINYLRFHMAKKEDPQEKKLLEQQLDQTLLIRSQIKTPKKKVEIQHHQKDPLTRSPHLGHEPMNISWRTGVLDRDYYMQFELNLLTHDLLDFDWGYPAFTQIKLLNFHGRHYLDQGRLFLQRFTVFDIYSFTPVNPLFNKLSWKGNLRLEKAIHHDPFKSDQVTLEGGFGYSWNIFHEKNLFYSFLKTHSKIGNIPQHFNYGLDLELGLLLNPFPKYKWHTIFNLESNFNHSQDILQFATLSLLQSYSFTSNQQLVVNATFFKQINKALKRASDYFLQYKFSF